MLAVRGIINYMPSPNGKTVKGKKDVHITCAPANTKKKNIYIYYLKHTHTICPPLPYRLKSMYGRSKTANFFIVVK